MCMCTCVLYAMKSMKRREKNLIAVITNKCYMSLQKLRIYELNMSKKRSNCSNLAHWWIIYMYKRKESSVWVYSWSATTTKKYRESEKGVINNYLSVMSTLSNTRILKFFIPLENLTKRREKKEWRFHPARHTYRFQMFEYPAMFWTSAFFHSSAKCQHAFKCFELEKLSKSNWNPKVWKRARDEQKKKTLCHWTSIQ